MSTHIQDPPPQSLSPMDKDNITCIRVIRRGEGYRLCGENIVQCEKCEQSGCPACEHWQDLGFPDDLCPDCTREAVKNLRRENAGLRLRLAAIDCWMNEACAKRPQPLEVQEMFDSIRTIASPDK